MPHRIPINLDLIATVGAVAAMGLAVLIIGSAAPGVNHYLLPVIFAVMVVPVIVYVRSGRTAQVAVGENSPNVPKVGAPPTPIAAPEPAPQVAPLPAPTPVVAVAPVVPPAPEPTAVAAPPVPAAAPANRTEVEEIVELKESLTKIETQLRSIQAVQLSMLENINHSMSAPIAARAATAPSTTPAPQAQSPAVSKKKEEDEPLAPIGLPLPPEAKPRGVIKVKDLETKQGEERGVQGEQEAAAEKMTEETASITPKKTARSLKTEEAEEAVEDDGGVKAKRVGKGSAGAGKPGAAEKEAKAEPLTRMEELNLLREELVKLRLKLDVEPRPK
jgi:hypothetical protein